jgi:hypothetical protein
VGEAELQVVEEVIFALRLSIGLAVLHDVLDGDDSLAEKGSLPWASTNLKAWAPCHCSVANE